MPLTAWRDAEKEEKRGVVAMSWRTLLTRSHVVQSSKRRRRVGAALLIGLALTIAACGSTTGVGAPPTPTPKPTATATATPVPSTTWRIVPSPNGKYPMSELDAASALSPSSAWAVGVTYVTGVTMGSPSNSLIEQWDGSAWHVVASGSAGQSALNSVAAIAPNDAWAVGGRAYYSGVGAGALTMHLNGTTWSVVPSAQPADAKSVTLYGVAALASNEVWAVGGRQADPDQLPQPVVERWDGAAWHLVSSAPLPQGAPSGAILTAVARIPGTNQLWAVGQLNQYLTYAPPHPLIERWDGTAWQIVPSPALPSDAMGGAWSGVVALSATNAWAVGRYALKNPMDWHPLIGHWDGTRWQIVVANPDAYGELDSVAATGATDVRAAGSLLTGSGASSGNGRRVPLIEQWNGTAWHVMASPEPSGAMSGSLSIASDGAGNYWAVGSYLNAANVYRTLTLHCT